MAGSSRCVMADSERQARRRTPQLTVVLDAVRTSGAEHPTAEQIYVRVRGRLPSISLGRATCAPRSTPGIDLRSALTTCPACPLRSPRH